MEGKTARGASSPAKPALHMPEPLSTTSAAISSSMANYQGTKEGCGHRGAARRSRCRPAHFRHAAASGRQGARAQARGTKEAQAGRVITIKGKRWSGGGPAAGSQTSAPSPNRRRQAPPSPRRRATGARAGGDHTQQEARADVPRRRDPAPQRNGPALAQPRAAARQVSLRTRTSSLGGGGAKKGLPPQRARAPAPCDRARTRSGIPAPTRPSRPRRARQAEQANRFGQRPTGHQGVIVASGSQHRVPLTWAGYGSTPASRIGSPSARTATLAGPQASCSEPERAHGSSTPHNAAAQGPRPERRVSSARVRSAARSLPPPFPGVRPEWPSRPRGEATARGGAGPGGPGGAAYLVAGVERRRRSCDKITRGWTRTRQWLRVAPPGFIGRHSGHSSHKRQLSERRALIGPAPLTHRPRRTAQLLPFLSFCKKKKRGREDGS